MDEDDLSVVEMFEQLHPDVCLVRVWRHRAQERHVDILGIQLTLKFGCYIFNKGRGDKGRGDENLKGCSTVGVLLLATWST